MIIILVKSKFLLKQFQKDYIWDGCFLILLLWSVKPLYVQIVYKASLAKIFLICKLVHTSRDKQIVEVVAWLNDNW